MTGSGKALVHRDPSPDTLFSNLNLFNPFTCSWEDTSFSVRAGNVQNVGGYARGKKECDLHGARVIPGLIDAHVHIESSLLVPTEFARLVLRHGTTTVVADPHEIANVLGMAGITYMREEAENTPLDILFMMPSCVPASSEDVGGAIITAADLAPLLQGDERILGLGEVMDVPAVLSRNPELMRKLRLTTLIDGHAPLLRGERLDDYLAAGIDSDHECTDSEEALEKLQKGMFLMLREGSNEKNLRDLLPAVTPCTLSRVSFATDDRHADILVKDGHIDDCVRIAASEGVELEIALRIATLSPCDRFHLRDRGALAPGRLADFCILADDQPFQVIRTFKKGIEVTHVPFCKSEVVRHTFAGNLPPGTDLRITGKGKARVIVLVKGQILTRSEVVPIDGDRMPDVGRDILKLLVCSRYRPGKFALGLVKGFGLREGALASSVAHDSHNVIAVGVDDRSLRRAAQVIISRNGGLAVITKGEECVLPLECAGLMSAEPYETVADALHQIEDRTRLLGCVEHPFMYLSFLALSVVPELRLTENGLYEPGSASRVPLFLG